MKLKSILESLNLNGNLYHATYSPFLKSIKSNGLNSTHGKYSWEDSVKGYTYLAIDPDVAISYAEENDNVPESYLDKIILLEIDVNKLDKNLLFVDQNVRNNDEISTYEYRGSIPFNFIKKVTSVN